MSPQLLTSQHYWLALKLVPRLTNDIKIQLVREYTLIGIFKLTLAQLKTMRLSEAQSRAILSPDINQIIDIYQQCQQHNIDIIDCFDEHYPQLLLQTHNPPIVLFTQGNLALLNYPQIAIVGSRSASISALEHSKSFAKSLSGFGLVITSGLAIGVDGCAHKGAISVSGYTIAVVATGLDRVYPTRHSSLVKQILACNGLIVSEYVPGSLPHPGCFPRRNRIITGMSVATFVIEATLKSGSLISAKSALEQNREVFAMPGAINNPQTKGCHSLIKQGAILVDEVSDITTVLASQGLLDVATKYVKKIEKTDSQDLFIDPLLSSVDYETTTVDTLVSRSQLPTEEVLTRLMALELRGLVSAVPGGYIRLN